MGDWWQALTGDLQIFYAIGFISSFFLLLQLAMLAFGIGTDIDVGRTTIPAAGSCPCDRWWRSPSHSAGRACS